VTLSPGVRIEAQTHLRDVGHLGPRVALTWAPFTSGHTTLRATYGLFYDWLPAATYEQTLRVDGVHEQEVIVDNPSYLIVESTSDGTNSGRLPTNRYTLDPDVQLGRTQRFDVGVDQAITPHVRAGVSYYIDRDDHTLRGRNLNAPVDRVIEAVSDASFLGRQ